MGVLTYATPEFLKFIDEKINEKIQFYDCEQLNEDLVVVLHNGNPKIPLVKCELCDYWIKLTYKGPKNANANQFLYCRFTTHLLHHEEDNQD